MRKFLLNLSLCFVLISASALALEQSEAPKSCELCGMDRTFFAHSRMLIVYADGSKNGTCSLHCAATALKTSQGKKVKSLQVGDFDTKKLTDAKKATWVIGGKKSGVMTNVAKWAFVKRSDAEKFVKEQGGKIATFDEALALAQTE
jgi:copper chaperone NosL